MSKSENENKPFAKDVFGRDVFMAESDEIKKAGSNVDCLLKLIAPFAAPRWDGLA